MSEYLEYPRNFLGICSVHISLSDWSDMEEFATGNYFKKDKN